MAGLGVDVLSRRERQIMDIIYRRAKATAAEVLVELVDPPSKTAVRTLLRILENKGELRHTQRGKTFVYMPTRPRGQVARAAFDHLLATFFEGSLEKAMAMYQHR